jgi:hypothetical protein
VNPEQKKRSSPLRLAALALGFWFLACGMAHLLQLGHKRSDTLSALGSSAAFGRIPITALLRCPLSAIVPAPSQIGVDALKWLAAPYDSRCWAFGDL